MKYNGWSILWGMCTLAGPGMIFEHGVDYIIPSLIVTGVYGSCLILNLRRLNNPEYAENKKIKDELKREKERRKRVEKDYSEFKESMRQDFIEKNNTPVKAKHLYNNVFAVEYATGRRGTEIVEINSPRFCLLTSLISLE